MATTKSLQTNPKFTFHFLDTDYNMKLNQIVSWEKHAVASHSLPMIDVYKKNNIANYSLWIKDTLYLYHCHTEL